MNILALLCDRKLLGRQFIQAQIDDFPIDFVDEAHRHAHGLGVPEMTPAHDQMGDRAALWVDDKLIHPANPGAIRTSNL